MTDDHIEVRDRDDDELPLELVVDGDLHVEMTEDEARHVIVQLAKLAGVTRADGLISRQSSSYTTDGRELNVWTEGGEDRFHLHHGGPYQLSLTPDEMTMLVEFAFGAVEHDL